MIDFAWLSNTRDKLKALRCLRCSRLRGVEIRCFILFARLYFFWQPAVALRCASVSECPDCCNLTVLLDNTVLLLFRFRVLEAFLLPLSLCHVLIFLNTTHPLPLVLGLRVVCFR